MKSFLVVMLIVTLKSNLCAQIEFEKGYFINNDGNKSVCLIRNIDWSKNPSKFDYKYDLRDDTIRSATIKNIKEFVVANLKYERFIVEIDRSSDDFAELSQVRTPQFTLDTLFLKYVVEGDANLFYYSEPGIRRFFFSVNKGHPKQLIYKRYIPSAAQIGTNNDFRKQISSNLICKDLSKFEISNALYYLKDLVHLFRSYNTCLDPEYENNHKVMEKDLFNLNFRPGVISHNVVLQNILGLTSRSFGMIQSFRFGVEVEFILPFNKNKWAFIVEPNYTYFKTAVVIDATVDAKIAEIPIGFRHYFFLNDHTKFFSNIVYKPTAAIKSKVDLEFGDPLKLVPGAGLAIGGGLNYNDVNFFELRYSFEQDLLRREVFWHTNYTSIAFIFGYSFF